ncbi:hypothetical protein ACFSNO_16225 [Streptomyces cirratus]
MAGPPRRAWTLLHSAVPEFARAAAAGLTTLTPLAGGPRAHGWGEAGRHGPGALGVPYGAGVRETALALLTGRRRARLRALTEVADLYALDGSGSTPRRGGSARSRCPAAGRRARAGGGGGVPAGDGGPRTGRVGPDPAGAGPAGRAAELTSTGKRLVAELRWESKAVDA